MQYRLQFQLALESCTLGQVHERDAVYVASLLQELAFGAEAALRLRILPRLL